MYLRYLRRILNLSTAFSVLILWLISNLLNILCIFFALSQKPTFGSPRGLLPHPFSRLSDNPFFFALSQKPTIGSVPKATKETPRLLDHIFLFVFYTFHIIWSKIKIVKKNFALKKFSSASQQSDTPPPLSPTYGTPIFFSRCFRTYGAKKIFFFSQKKILDLKKFSKKNSIFFLKNAIKWCESYVEITKGALGGARPPVIK